MRGVTIERVANWGLIVTCVLLSSQTAVSLYQRAFPPKPSFGYSAGDVIQDSPELGLSKASVNVLMMTASSCHFCSASMPFYRHLVDVARESGARVVGVTAEEPDKNREYLLANGVTVETVASVRKNSIRLRATPTLVLVRSDGKVMRVWNGLLNGASEEEVLQSVRRKL